LAGQDFVHTHNTNPKSKTELAGAFLTGQPQKQDVPVFMISLPSFLVLFHLISRMRDQYLPDVMGPFAGLAVFACDPGIWNAHRLGPKRADQLPVGWFLFTRRLRRPQISS